VQHVLCEDEILHDLGWVWVDHQKRFLLLVDCSHEAFELCKRRLSPDTDEPKVVSFEIGFEPLGKNGYHICGDIGYLLDSFVVHDLCGLFFVLDGITTAIPAVIWNKVSRTINLQCHIRCSSFLFYGGEFDLL